MAIEMWLLQVRGRQILNIGSYIPLIFLLLSSLDDIACEIIAVLCFNYINVRLLLHIFPLSHHMERMELLE